MTAQSHVHAGVVGKAVPMDLAHAYGRRRRPTGPSSAFNARRRDAVTIGLAAFLATVVMLFAAFVSAYLVRRAAVDWVPVALPSVLWLNTGVLLISSLTLEIWAMRKATPRWLMATIAFGLLFLLGQAEAWRQLWAAGVFLPSNPHSSFFFVMSGVHGLHVMAALSVLIYTVIQTPARVEALTGVCRLFWHVLGGLWLAVVLVLSIL